MVMIPDTGIKEVAVAFYNYVIEQDRKIRMDKHITNIHI